MLEKVHAHLLDIAEGRQFADGLDVRLGFLQQIPRPSAPAKVYNGEQAVSPRLAKLPLDRVRFHIEQFLHLFRAHAPVTAFQIRPSIRVR